MESKYDGQSLQEAKISELVYSLCSWFAIVSLLFAATSIINGNPMKLLDRFIFAA